MTEETVSKIQALNDQLRQTGAGGKIVCTQVVSELSTRDADNLFSLIRSFDNFTEDDDPHGEHDFGSVEYNGQKYFWKIDYYNHDMTGGSEDPSDPKQTTRVLTIMTAQEY